MSEPLTEQEEAELRAFVADGVLHNPPFTLVARLLATIDAERASRRHQLSGEAGSAAMAAAADRMDEAMG